jgi:hypothetical protein
MGSSTSLFYPDVALFHPNATNTAFGQPSGPPSGFRVPRPLEVSEHHGQATPQTIFTEPMMLTKVNWNSCRIDCSEPITTQFAKRVGMILTEVKDGSPREKKHKFFM